MFPSKTRMYGSWRTMIRVAFLAGFPDGGVLDEVQRAPQLMSYLQSRVDADGRMGLFLLTGSQQFGLMSGITQSLAGRTAFVELLPFSVAELRAAGLMPSSLDEMLFTGAYPPIHDRGLKPPAWLAAYVTAYVERDVRQFVKVQDLETFQRFVRLCAGRCGQILNLSSLAADCGVTHNTAKAWISVLEASYILFLLRPHHANFSKRMVKSPKLYFYDSGLLCWLLGIRQADQLAVHPLRGGIFESFAIAELLKAGTESRRTTHAAFLARQQWQRGGCHRRCRFADAAHRNQVGPDSQSRFFRRA
jgi:predicted AAA+ superfamily ATPase